MHPGRIRPAYRVAHSSALAFVVTISINLIVGFVNNLVTKSNNDIAQAFNESHRLRVSMDSVCLGGRTFISTTQRMLISFGRIVRIVVCCLAFNLARNYFLVGRSVRAYVLRYWDRCTLADFMLRLNSCLDLSVLEACTSKNSLVHELLNSSPLPLHSLLVFLHARCLLEPERWNRFLGFNDLVNLLPADLFQGMVNLNTL